MIESSTQEFKFNELCIQLVVPNGTGVKQLFDAQLKSNENFPFPFWAKVWPSSIALANFLVKESNLIRGKYILELAAGLGLPSLVAAKFAAKVTCSDYLKEPFTYVEKSVAANSLNNISCSILNWNSLPKTLTADVVLLSDINYEPTAFNQLFAMIQFFLQQQSTIILATPQRIIAKPFIEAILPFCVQQTESIIDETVVSILVLGENN